MWRDLTVNSASMTLVNANIDMGVASAYRPLLCGLSG
jgi:hypothetical protein